MKRLIRNILLLLKIGYEKFYNNYIVNIL